MSKSLKEESRKPYSIPDSRIATDPELIASCLMRVADATELMASNYISLQKDLDWYKKAYQARGVEIKGLTNTNRTLRGHVTRLKSKNQINGNS